MTGLTSVTFDVDGGVARVVLNRPERLNAISPDLLPTRACPCPRKRPWPKVFCLEMVGQVTDKALRIFGGRGLTMAYPIERLYRDARALWFEEGTAEIQKTVIARELLDGHPRGWPR